MVFEIDPSNGLYARRRVPSDPTMLPGYAGFAQELSVTKLGKVLCSVFVHDDELVLRIGSTAWDLFEPGLQVTHRRGMLHGELCLSEPTGRRVTFRYRRKDPLLEFIDSAYDEMDFEQAHLPAALPALAQRKEEELVAEWSARMAAQ